MTTRKPIRGRFSLVVLLFALFGSCTAGVAPTETNLGGSENRQSASDVLRLRSLAVERSTVSPDKNYVIGPDDLIEVAVFNVDEMHRKLRVDTDGKIQLPLIGAVKATGLSEAQVAEEIAARLRAFVRDPQVTVFVQEYKSQQIGVTGAVAKPGLYSLPRERRTILDMLSEAGGLTRDAGALLQFIPTPVGVQKAAPDLKNPPRNDPRGVTIELSELMRGGPNGPLNLPVVPGDVVFVPEAGSFTIEGWIDKPGTYPISRNSTVLAALSAGGGPLLPARLNRVELLRSGEGANTNRSVMIVDVKAVREGREADVALLSGDVIRVPGYVALIVPWGIFTFVRSLVSVGTSLPII